MIPAAFLDALRPELERRLAASPLGSERGEALISFYTSSLRFAYEHGTIGAFVAGPPIQAPVSAGGSGIPPDAVAALMVGPHTIEELDALHPDVLPGTQRALMDILFPGLVADVQTWVAP